MSITNALRAGVGQGLGMGWGDEGEAWLRAKLGDQSYEDNLKRIRDEYGAYSKENPWTSGATEFVGGALPGVGMMLIPGGQAAGAAQLARTTGSTLARMGGLGALTGAVSGSGSAKEGSRLEGGATGAGIGGILGVGLPLGMQTTGGAYRWLRERLGASPAYVTERAAAKANKALADSQLEPSDITRVMGADRGMGVPSVVANVDRGLSDLAETVAQRTGRGARQIEQTLEAQKLGSRERVHQQIVKALKPGDYYDDVATITKQMRANADPAYKLAYSHGTVTDPEVLKFMKLPQFQQGAKEAEKLLAAEGRSLPLNNNTVEYFDQVKRGLDTLIEGQTDAVTGKVTNLGRIYGVKKNEFLEALDLAVPDYGKARALYKGDADILTAMRSGINDFGKMDHEQVAKLVAKMGPDERDAFRTGVSRDLYGRIMGPSSSRNSAQNLLAPEQLSKLQILFDNPGEFKLFQAALQRESQLFNQSGRILAGAQTLKRKLMAEDFASESGVGQAIASTVTGGWAGSLMSLFGAANRSGAMTDKKAARLAEMLMSKDPHEVAAVVRILEEQAKSAIPKALRAGVAEAGVVTGAASSMWPAPAGEMQRQDIEPDMQGAPALSGPDIEADIEADAKAEAAAKP